MSSVYIIAEAGVNHNGSLDLARQLINVAADAGTNAIKFQTFKADRLVSRNTPKAEYQKNTTDAGESQFEMLKKLELDESAHKKLIDYCQKKKIEFLSTPFDFKSVDLLVHTLHLTRLKLSSGDITNAPLLLKAAQSSMPVILSTGMSMLGEIEMALGVLAFGYTQVNEIPSLKAFQEAYRSEAGQQVLREKVMLLHCTTEYPAPFEDVNLRAMDTLRTAFGLPVGYSDHTPGITVAIAAAARGAAIIEKHFTLDRNLPGPDHQASLEPGELKIMARSIRQVEAALGSSLKFPSPSEARNMPLARKSIVAAKEIKKGDLLTEENITVKRPGSGISPMYYWQLTGTAAAKDYKKNEMVSIWAFR